jgi:photosystem II stability/assembly factor-like uncharacterized protein
MKNFGLTFRRLTGLALLTVVYWACATVLPAHAQRFFLRRWSVSEFQPDVKQGGRANGIAVNPANNNVIYVASETGGLFKSTDRGLHWNHIDSLPIYRLGTVALVPGSPQTVLVTSIDSGFRAASAGGVWRSTDGGASWTHATNPAGVSGRYSAYEISAAPDTGALYVSTALGCFVSTDGGMSWTYRNVFGIGDLRTFAVVALGADRVIAAGPAGIRHSSNGGASWTTANTGLGSVWDMHALGRSTFSDHHAYIVNGATNLFYTTNDGADWTAVSSAPSGGGGCGGITFAKTVPRKPVGAVRQQNVYFGNRCGLTLIPASFSTLTGIVTHSATVQNLSLDHSDTRDLAFDASNNPLLLATDGGLHNTADGGASWRFVGGGRDGYNALQITEVKGQQIASIDRHLYFGTQDNDLWSSADGGNTWTNGMCCEGFFIEAQRRVATSSDSKVTNVACGACFNAVSDPLFNGVAWWTDPAGDVAGNPMIVRRSRHVQGVNDSGGFMKGLATTGNLGGAWQQYVRFAEDRRDLPKLGAPGNGGFIGFFTSTLLYQPIRTGWDGTRGFEINKLMTIEKPSWSLRTRVRYPAMNGFGGLGINPTMFAWYQVYGVDPGTPRHLIAPDVVNERVMESRDGGENWTEIPGLTNLVTDSGRLQFRSWILPLVTAVSFSPYDPNKVMIGTSEGGLYVSSDNGATWGRIPDSEGVTYATSIHWTADDSAVVSTYGRGLWRVTPGFFIKVPDFSVYCRPPCLPEFYLPREDLAWGILVYSGWLKGVRLENEMLREIFLTPGARVVYVGEGVSEQVKVTHTASAKVGFAGLPSTPHSEQPGWFSRGLLLDRDNRPVGTIFSNRQEKFMQPALDQQQRNYQQQQQGQTKGSGRDRDNKSPAESKPYVRLRTKRFDGAPTAFPGEAMQLSISNFTSGTAVEILIDGRPVQYQSQRETNGTFTAEITAPREEGLHSLEVRLKTSNGTLVDGVMFFVKHQDEPDEQRKRPQRPGGKPTPTPTSTPTPEPTPPPNYEREDEGAWKTGPS